MRTILPIALFAVAVACASVACASVAAEQPAGGGLRMMQQLEKADANGDGAVSKQEFIAHRENQFPRLDRNKDGFFTDSDIPRFMKNRMPAGFTPGQMREQYDANGDGKVSEQEFVQGPAPVFDRVDANADGHISPSELQTARTLMAQR